MFKKIDHIGIRVVDLDATLDQYKRLYKLEPERIEVMEELFLRIAFIPVGDVLVELLQPTESGAGRVGKDLAEKGEGLDHIAFEVEDVDNLLVSLTEAGIGLRDKKARRGAGGTKIAFIEAAYTQNVMTELLEKKKGSEE